VTAVIKTSANNTGNAVETILVLVVVFLAISLPGLRGDQRLQRMLARRGVVTVMTILLDARNWPSQSPSVGARLQPTSFPRPSTPR